MAVVSDLPTEDRGRTADSPAEMPILGWNDVLLRVWVGMREERVLLISGGAAFFLLLGLFPAITAFVSIYGLFFDPKTAMKHVVALEEFFPRSGIEIIRERLQHVASQGKGSLTLSLGVGVVFAFWGANRGVKAIFDAINVAYEEKEKRSFVHLNVLASLFTLAAILTVIVLISALGILPTILDLIGFGPITKLLVGAGRWIALIMLLTAGISLLYRYGPSRNCAKWPWITWGGALAAGAWVAASASFSFFLRNFDNFEPVYGSLGALIGLLMWIWISVTIVIVGAKINAELEHQTTRDTTVGPPRSKGERGAVVADHTGPAGS